MKVSDIQYWMIKNHLESPELLNTMIKKQGTGSEGGGKNVLNAACRRAKTIVFLSDGAEWLDRMRERVFPGSIHVLDWYHTVHQLSIMFEGRFSI